MVTERMSLHFDGNNSIRVVMTNKKGIVTTKNIGYTAFRECVTTSTVLSGGISTGLLPPGFLSYDYRYNGEAEETISVFEYGKLYEDITYRETVYPDFPLPRFIFSFSANKKGLVKTVKIGIVPLNQPITDKTSMFYYPFSNIVDTPFHMCIGRNHLLIKELSNIQSLAQVLVRAPNNDDLYRAEKNKPQLEQRDLMELLKDKDPQYYYDHILVPIPNVTVKNFINNGVMS